MIEILNETARNIRTPIIRSFNGFLGIVIILMKRYISRRLNNKTITLEEVEDISRPISEIFLINILATSPVLSPKELIMSINPIG